MKWKCRSEGGRPPDFRAWWTRLRVISVLLVAALVLGLVAIPGLWTGSARADTGTPTPQNQVVFAGEKRYFNDAGQQLQGTPSDYAVSIEKKLTQVQSAGVLQENQFQVDLTVETATNYKDVVTTKDAAVVLVLDMSASMEGQCAQCGRPLDQGQDSDYVRTPAHCDSLESAKYSAPRSWTTGMCSTATGEFTNREAQWVRTVITFYKYLKASQTGRWPRISSSMSLSRVRKPLRLRQPTS